MKIVFCPECGCKLIPDGGCPYCPCCAWSFCDGELPTTEEILRQQKITEEAQDDDRN